MAPPYGSEGLPTSLPDAWRKHVAASEGPLTQPSQQQIEVALRAMGYDSNRDLGTFALDCSRLGRDVVMECIPAGVKMRHRAQLMALVDWLLLAQGNSLKKKVQLDENRTNKLELSDVQAVATKPAGGISAGCSGQNNVVTARVSDDVMSEAEASDDSDDSANIPTNQPPKFVSAARVTRDSDDDSDNGSAQQLTVPPPAPPASSGLMASLSATRTGASGQPQGSSAARAVKTTVPPDASQPGATTKGVAAASDSESSSEADKDAAKPPALPTASPVASVVPKASPSGKKKITANSDSESSNETNRLALRAQAVLGASRAHIAGASKDSDSESSDKSEALPEAKRNVSALPASSRNPKHSSCGDSESEMSQDINSDDDAPDSAPAVPAASKVCTTLAKVSEANAGSDSSTSPSKDGKARGGTNDENCRVFFQKVPRQLKKEEALRKMIQKNCEVLCKTLVSPPHEKWAIVTFADEDKAKKVLEWANAQDHLPAKMAKTRNSNSKGSGKGSKDRGSRGGGGGRGRGFSNEARTPDQKHRQKNKHSPDTELKKVDFSTPPREKRKKHEELGSEPKGKREKHIKHSKL